jgi:serine protease AprX
VQEWQHAIGAEKLWSHDAVTCATDPDTGLPTDPSCEAISAYVAPAPPTIAVVDSGIDGSRTDDFGGRVIGHTSFVATQTNADDYGHGTFVASIAAGSASSYPGVAPTANLYDLRVMDANGVANTSDVIAAADWILENRETYNIKVANFSLHSAKPNSFKFDPLDTAVESLWFKDVVVVAASGNFGVDAATPSNMYFAPGNDPFVITVGAADTHDTASTSDDDTAPWSAFGYTADGFAKPELVAPGRYMIGAVPVNGTMPAERADHVVAPGYMQISGTSFAAPAVAGSAANLLALHPDWTADQVKGALMQTARPLDVPNALSAGVGEIDEAAAAAVDTPVNPNAALDQFVSAGSFDSAAWQTAAESDMSWSDMSWSDMSWSDMSWSDMSWSDMSWASMSWSDQSQADASTADMSWADGSSVD